MEIQDTEECPLSLGEPFKAAKRRDLAMGSECSVLMGARARVQIRLSVVLVRGRGSNTPI
jgi:hypothetical protein